MKRETLIFLILLVLAGVNPVFAQKPRNAVATGGEAQEAPKGKSGLPFVRIPAGEYLRGFGKRDGFREAHRYSNSPLTEWETPQHRVTITKEFDIAAIEVPVGLFQQFVKATKYVTDAEKNGGALGFFPSEKSSVDMYQKNPQITWKTPGFEQSPNHPVTCVSWNDAKAFCEWLSKMEGAKIRLPTEAEWEYAANAGGESWYSWGADPDDAYAHANVADAALEEKHPGMTSYQRAVRLQPGEGDGHVFTAPVASFKPSPWNLFDMHGNVWEWCEDRFRSDVYEIQLKDVSRGRWLSEGITDPFFDEPTDRHKYGDWRAMRGGAWNCGPANVRTTIRTFLEASDSAVYTGFRVVRER